MVCLVALAVEALAVLQVTQAVQALVVKVMLAVQLQATFGAVVAVVVLEPLVRAVLDNKMVMLEALA
jgi:hypothetical protein